MKKPGDHPLHSLFAHFLSLGSTGANPSAHWVEAGNTPWRSPFQHRHPPSHTVAIVSKRPKHACFWTEGGNQSTFADTERPSPPGSILGTPAVVRQQHYLPLHRVSPALWIFPTNIPPSASCWGITIWVIAGQMSGAIFRAHSKLNSFWRYGSKWRLMHGSTWWWCCTELQICDLLSSHRGLRVKQPLIAEKPL